MSEGPWIRFFPSDWLAGTRGMTAAETGIYITLVAMMYERGDPIPNETGRLARLCGTTTAAMKATLAVLIDEGKITLTDEGLWNDRVGVETEIRRDKSISAQQAAEARWKKTKRKQRKPDANELPMQSEGNANQSQSITPSNEGVARTPKPTPRSELEKVLDPERAAAVIEHRLAKRSKLTAHIAAKLAAQLAKWPDPNEAADEMMLAGWTGFKPEWLERRLAEARGQGPPRGTQPSRSQRELNGIDEAFDAREQSHRPDEGSLASNVLSLPKPGTGWA